MNVKKNVSNLRNSSLECQSADKVGWNNGIMWNISHAGENSPTCQSQHSNIPPGLFAILFWLYVTSVTEVTQKIIMSFRRNPVLVCSKLVLSQILEVYFFLFILLNVTSFLLNDILELLCNFGSVSKKFKFISLTIFSLMIIVNETHAQSIGRVGTTAASFLKIGVGGRALAMGEAYATQAEDITAMYWNPAGLSNINQMQVIINHYDYVADLYFDYGGFAVPVAGVGTFGFSIGYLGMPDIERTTVEFQNGTGEKVSANSFVIALSYARALTDRFSIGGNMKYIGENIWHSSASGFAFDVGVMYKTFFKNLKIGMSISNFGTEMQMIGRDMLVQHDIDPTFEGNNENLNAHLDTDKFPLPILFRVGLSSNILQDFFNVEKYDWIVSFDAVHPNDDKEYMNVGTEVVILDLISLRAGYRKLFLEDSEGGLTFGTGLHLKVFGSTQLFIDYANVDLGRLDHQNKFSLILSF